MVRAIIHSQVWLSKQVDSVLPPPFRIDGSRDFSRVFGPSFLRKGQRVYDVGSGKTPFNNLARKAQFELTVIGIDISQSELDRAPEGTYDSKICSDISVYRGNGDGDLVVSRAVLEHVENVEGAFTAIASILKPGGKAVIFVPSRNALFARLNLLLPQKVKQRILFAFFPRARKYQGLPSYYRNCTPKEFIAVAERSGLVLHDARYYFASNYFSIFTPIHALWRVWIIAFRAIARNQAAESFAMCFRKTGLNSES